MKSITQEVCEDLPWLCFMALLIAAVCSAVQAGCGTSGNRTAPAATNTYERGAGDALDAIMLLDLELKLKGERKQWSEMAIIVKQRLGATNTVALESK